MSDRPVGNSAFDDGWCHARIAEGDERVHLTVMNRDRISVTIALEPAELTGLANWLRDLRRDEFPDNPAPAPPSGGQETT